MKLILQEIAKLVDGSIDGDNSTEVYGLESLENADINQISYAVSEKYKEALIKSKAGAIIVNEKLKEHCNTNAIIVQDVYLAYSILSHIFKHTQDINNLRFGNDISYPNTKIASSSLIGKNVIGVYPHKLFCNNLIKNECISHDNKNIYFFDSNHLSVKGSEIVNELILQKIRDD